MNLVTKALNRIRPIEQPKLKSLENKPETYFQFGKSVRVINNLEHVKRVERKCGGGWTDEMKQCLNEVCTVITVDPDKMIQVKTKSGKMWLFKKESLESVDSEDENDPVSNVPRRAVSQSNEHAPVVKVPSKTISQSNLFKAIEKGNLMEINPKIPSNLLNKKNRDGMTPLFFACFIGNLDIAIWLCNKGADPKIPDKSGELPIHNCALNRNYDILAFLIERFPSTVIALNKNGETLLDITKMLGDKTIETLIINQIDKRSSSNNAMAISDQQKTFHGQNDSIVQSQKTKFSSSLCNMGSIGLPHPPEDSCLRLSETLNFVNINKKQFLTESISSNNEIIPEPPKTLNKPKDSIVQSQKTNINISLDNLGSMGLPYPPEDNCLFLCKSLKLENTNIKQNLPEYISSYEILPDPPKTLNRPKDSIPQSKMVPVDGNLFNAGLINLLNPPEDSFKSFKTLKFENTNIKHFLPELDEYQGNKKNVIYFSEENYQLLKEILNNPDLQQLNTIVDDINNIINIFYNSYQNELFQNIKNIHEIILPMNCVFITINILSKLIENKLVTNPFSFTPLIDIFLLFSDLADSNALSERLCESILYAVCSNQKLSSIQNSISEKRFINKLKICFLNKRVSEEIKLASSVILINCYEKHENNIKELHNELLEYVKEISTKIDENQSDNYFGFSGKEITDAISKMTENVEDLKVESVPI